MSFDEIRTDSILAQFVNATSVEDKTVKYAIDPDNPNTWYVLVHNIDGNDDEFKDGEWLFKIQIPKGEGKTWIKSPPRFIALTPNGIYDVNMTCCVHIGEYHKGAKTASLGVAEFVMVLVSGMIGWKDLSHGINLINMNTNAAQKAEITKKSKAYNQEKYSHVLNMINEWYDRYSPMFLTDKSATMTPADRKKRNIIFKTSLNKLSINPKGLYDDVDRFQ